MRDSYHIYTRSLVAGLLLSFWGLWKVEAKPLCETKGAVTIDRNSFEIDKNQMGRKQESIQKMISQGERLLGHRYRARGIAPWPLDCSGYVSYLYSKIGLTLPRSSASMAMVVKRVSNPKPGDLVFFRGRNASSSRVGHVALVVDNDGDDLVIMHSTNSRGIIKHRLASSAYFSRRYLYAGRVEALACDEGGDKLSRVPQGEYNQGAYLWSQILDKKVANLLQTGSKNTIE